VLAGKFDGTVDQPEKEAVCALIEKWEEHLPVMVASPINIESPDDFKPSQLFGRLLRRRETSEEACIARRVLLLGPGWDRQLHYGCCEHEYVDLLRSYGGRISMSRTGNPYDNALAESFMRKLKCEEVYLHTYRDRQDALLHIQEFLDNI
jgi:Integrase core domain